MKNYTKYAFLALLVAMSGLSAQPRSLRDRWNDWRFVNSRVGRFLKLNQAVASEAAVPVEPVEQIVSTVGPVSQEEVEAVLPVVTPEVSTWEYSAKAWLNSAKETGNSAWQSTKDAGSEGWNKTKNGFSSAKDGLNKGCGWVGTQLNGGYNWSTGKAKTGYNWTTGKLSAAKAAVTNSFKADAGYGQKVVKAVKDHPYVAAATAGVVAYPVVKKLAKTFWNAQPNHKFGMVFVPAALVGLAAHAGVQMPQVDPYLVASAAGGCAAVGALDYLLHFKKGRVVPTTVTEDLSESMGRMEEID